MLTVPRQPMTAVTHPRWRKGLKKTEENFTFTGGHKLSWWNFVWILNEREKKNKRSNLIKRICTLAPRRGGEARFDKSDMWAARARREFNPSLPEKKKVWNGVTEENVLQKEKTDFRFVAFRLCKRIRKRVCAVLLIHFYFCSELSPSSVSQRKRFKRVQKNCSHKL